MLTRYKISIEAKMSLVQNSTASTFSLYPEGAKQILALQVDLFSFSRAVYFLQCTAFYERSSVKKKKKKALCTMHTHLTENRTGLLLFQLHSSIQCRSTVILSYTVSVLSPLTMTQRSHLQPSDRRGHLSLKRTYTSVGAQTGLQHLSQSTGS